MMTRTAATDLPHLQDETVNEVAKKLDRTPTQVLLRWGLQHGSSVLPKSANPEHLKVCAFQFELFSFDTFTATLQV